MILVTGGAGVMGRRLVTELVARGDRVRVLDRQGTHLEVPDVELRHGDVTHPPSLAGVCDGVQTVFHLAAVLIAQDPSVFETVNVGGTRNVIRSAAAAGVQHFIFVSSASVVYPHTTPYSRSKRECERLVREQEVMRWTIVRPTLAYNEDGGEEFRMFLSYLERYPVVPFIGRGRALKSPVHVDDLVHGFLAVIGNSRAYGKVYNFSGGEVITIRDLARLMLAHRGISKPFVTVPVAVCKAAAWVLARTMRRPPLTWNVIAGITQDADLDNSDARRDLGYHPIGVREGLERSFPRGQPAGVRLSRPWGGRRR
jgi:NADH dehydrogenase